MANLSKRAKVIAEKVVADKQYPIDEALALIKDLSKVKFTESVDVAINLGIDPRKSDQVVRGSTTLPQGSGKTVRVAVFTQGAAAEAATEAGADVVGMDELAASMKGGDLNYDVVIASPDAMRVVGQLGQILGPRGLMPNPKAGQIRFRADKAGIIHGSVGTAKFEVAALKENIDALLESLKKAKPTSAKGQYFMKMTVSSTMGPGLTIDTSSLEAIK